MIKHGAIKGRCIEWFSRVVRGLNFRSAESTGIRKRGIKVDIIFNQLIFFCWRLLGLIPGGTPFSQLNNGVRDAVSATTERDV